MAYPSHFHRLVLGGTLYTETWNTSLSIAGDLPEVSDTMLSNIAALISSWFTSTGLNSPYFYTTTKLTEIKLNRIDTDGHYEDDVSQTWVYPTPLSGPATAAPGPAPQLTPVVTLRTAVERGRANRGRMYLPPASGFANPSSDGRAVAADALRIANGVATLINSLRAAYVAQYGPGANTGVVSVMSNIGAGAQQRVTRVEVGRVIDTMRSRRSSLLEDRQQNTTAILAPVLLDV